MKPAYNNFELATGAHLAGLCQVQIVPKEWLTSELSTNFLTGEVEGPLTLESGKSWLTLEFTEDSYQFEEKHKVSRFADYYETTIAGLFNKLDANLRRQIESIRYHELVVVAKDRDKSLRVIGSKAKGMKIFFGLMSSNGSGGIKQTSIELKIDMPHTAPYLSV